MMFILEKLNPKETIKSAKTGINKADWILIKETLKEKIINYKVRQLSWNWTWWTFLTNTRFQNSAWIRKRKTLDLKSKIITCI